MPLRLSNRKSFQICHSFIYKERFVVESTTVVSNNDTSLLLKAKIVFMVQIKADCNDTNVKEKDFCEIIQFIKDYLSLFNFPWFQRAKNMSHKVSIRLVFPSVKVVPVKRIFLFVSEILFVINQILFKQELMVNLILNFFRHLFQNILVFLSHNRLIFILFPFISEKAFKVLFYFLIERLRLIKMLQNTHKLCQIFIVFEGSIEFLNFDYHFDKFTHDICED